MLRRTKACGHVFWLLVFTLLFTALPVDLYAADNQAAKTIRSASEYDYPPFCTTTESNEADGFSVELLRAVLGEMGYAVSFKVGPWAEVKESLVAREVQVLPLVGRTPEREAVFDFTFPYMTMHGTIVVRAGEDQIKSLDDLQGKRIAVMAGDNAEEFVRRQNLDASISSTTSFKEALLELSQGKQDAVIIQKLLYVQLLNELDISNLKMVGAPLQEFKQSFCFAVAKGDADLLGILNEGLSIVMADGTFQNLRKKWFAPLEEPARSRIVVGGDFNYPPYEYLDENGEPAGYNIELTKAIARNLGLQVHFELGHWEEIRGKLANKEIDMVQGMFYSSERDKVFDFTDHHALVSHVAVVRSGAEIPQSMADLAGKAIVVMRSDIMHEKALQAGFSDNLILAESQQEALQILSAGRGDCALIARLPAMYWIQKDNLSNLSVGENSFATAEYCYASYHGNQALVERFSLALSNLKATGEYRKIYNKWLGIYQQPGLSSWVVIKYILIVTIPILLLLLAVFVWSQSLKKQVRLRTRDLEAEVIERKQAEQALRDSEAKQRAMVENILDVITIMGKDGAIRFTSRNIEKWLGWRPEERIGASPWENIHPDDRDHARIIFADLVEKPGLTATTECRYRRKDGGYEWIEFSGINRLQDPNIAGILINFHIITERKQTEEILRESEERFRLLVENAPDAIFARNKRGCFTYLNKAAIALFGATSAQELIGTPIIERYHPKVRETLLRRMQIINEEQHAAPLRQTICLQLNGNEVNVETTAVPMNYMGEDGALVFMRDITDRVEDQKRQQQLEEQLHQSQKIESIGQLAGGVAHDFNNMLSVIIGHAEMALMKAGPSSPFISDLEEIRKASKRSADLTRQLLTFARKQVIAPRVLDLNEAVAGTLKMLQRLIGENIQLIWSPAANLWPVKVDPSQLDQILANLCVNSRDAISSIGKISIKTANTSWDEDAIASRPYDVVPGDYVLLSVSDDGCGMDKKVQAHIFEPFYTTKEAGSGTGLGLATVYGAVKQNRGFFTVYSEPGLGTVFNIYFPRTIKAAEAKPETAEKPLLRGNETVLLVEDDEMLLRLVTSMLEESGYTVLAAATTVLAQTLAKEHPGTIHLLISDMIMPVMNGKELSEKLMPLRPDMKILFLSGYTADIISNQGIIKEDINFLQKPFSFEALTVKVREVLGDH